MGYNDRGRRYQTYGKRSIGLERALEHIREAEALTRELGGTDEDVKEYFFSLSPRELHNILNVYEIQYGKEKRDYAEKTFPNWRNRSVHMSGLVAERLFKLLPPIMPLEKKYQLIESLWKYVGPSSTKHFYIGLDANIEEVSQRVKAHLEEVVILYKIPSSIESRFNWLSQGDVGIKQQLLNYFRQQEKLLLSEALRTQLPVLLAHLNSEKGSLTNHVTQNLKIGKHEVFVTVDERVNGISETAPVRKKSINIWLWLVIAIIVVLWLLNK